MDPIGVRIPYASLNDVIALLNEELYGYEEQYTRQEVMDAIHSQQARYQPTWKEYDRDGIVWNEWVAFADGYEKPRR